MMRIWWHIKRWWARIRGRDAVTVRPRFRTPTYVRFERACILLGLHPDAVRKGEQTVDAADVGDVFTVGPKVLDVICTNGDVLPLDSMERPAAEHYVATLAARFFFLCSRRWLKERASLRTMLNGVE